MYTKNLSKENQETDKDHNNPWKMGKKKTSFYTLPQKNQSLESVGIIEYTVSGIVLLDRCMYHQVGNQVSPLKITQGVIKHVYNILYYFNK